MDRYYWDEKIEYLKKTRPLYYNDDYLECQERLLNSCTAVSGGPAMGIQNYLIEGVSGAGKTSVCNEMQRRGYHAIHGDRELAYQGDPETGIPTEGATYEHHIWHVDKVKALVANKDEPVTFFCGASRNYSKFINLFDGVFVLEVDLETSLRRIDERVARDPTDWGGRPEEREIIARVHRTKEGVPKNGIIIDATAPVAHVVDEILYQIGVGSRGLDGIAACVSCKVLQKR